MKQYALITIVLVPAMLGSVDQWKIGNKRSWCLLHSTWWRLYMCVFVLYVTQNQVRIIK